MTLLVRGEDSEVEQASKQRRTSRASEVVKVTDPSGTHEAINELVVIKVAAIAESCRGA